MNKSIEAYKSALYSLVQKIILSLNSNKEEKYVKRQKDKIFNQNVEAIEEQDAEFAKKLLNL